MKEETIKTLEGEVERLESENAKFQSACSQYWEKWEVLTQSRKLLAREVTRLRRTVLKNGCRRNSTKSMPDLWREMSCGFATNLDFNYNEDTLGNLSFDFQDLEFPFSSFETPPPELSHSVLEGLTTGEPLNKSLKSQTSKVGETKGTSWDEELPANVSGSTSLFNSLVSDPFASFLLEEKPQKYTTNGIGISEEGVQENTEGVQEQEEDKLSPLSIIQSSSLDDPEHSSAEMQEEWLLNYSSNGSRSSTRQESREQSNWEALPFPKSSFAESCGNEPYLAKATSPHLEYDKVSYECFDPVFSSFLLSENVNICVKPEVTQLEKELALSITIKENHLFQPQRSNLFIQSRASWISFTDKASPKSVSFSSTESLSKEGLKCVRKTFETRNRLGRRGPRLLSKKILSPGNSEDSVSTMIPSREMGFKASPPSHGYIRSLAQELAEQPSPRPLRESTNKNPKISVLSKRSIKGKDSKVEGGKSRSVRTRRSATIAKNPQDCIKCHRILETSSLGSSSVRKRSTFTKGANNSSRMKLLETNKPRRVAIKQNTGLSQRPQTGYALGLPVDRQGKPHSDFTRNPDLNPNIKNAQMKYALRVSNKSETKIKHPEVGRKLERLTNKRLVPYPRNVLRRSDQDFFTYTESKSPNLRLQIDPYGESSRVYPQGESRRCTTFRETSHPVICPDKFILNTSNHSHKHHLKTNDRYKRYPDNNEEYLKLTNNICPPERRNNVRDRRSHIKIGKLTIWEKVEGRGERISGRRRGGKTMYR